MTSRNDFTEVCEDFRQWAKTASYEEAEDFSKMPVFDTPWEALLFFIVHLQPDRNYEDIVRDWGVSEGVARWISSGSVAGMVLLGTDEELDGI